jgi:hypothetical protein
MPTYQAHSPSPSPSPSPEPDPHAARQAPHAAEQGPDPSGQKPHGYFRDCFFGTLAPITKTVEWSGHTNECALRILEADEQRWCSQYAFERAQGHAEAESYLQARTIGLLARSLEAVDGVPVSTECKNLEHRLQLAAELPDTLQEALIAAYDEARYEPIKLLSEMQEHGDPFGGKPTGDGCSPEPEVSPNAV